MLITDECLHPVLDTCKEHYLFSAFSRVVKHARVCGPACVHACVRVRACVRVLARVCARVRVRVHARVCARAYVRVCVRARACVRVCARACVRMGAGACVHPTTHPYTLLEHAHTGQFVQIGDFLTQS